MGLLGFDPGDIGVALIGHLAQDRGRAGVGDRSGETAALRDAGAHVRESRVVHADDIYIG